MKDFRTDRVYDQLAAIPLTTRTVIAYAFVSEGEDHAETWTQPVFGFVTAVEHGYRATRGSMSNCRTHDEYLQDDWIYDGNVLRVMPVTCFGGLLEVETDNDYSCSEAKEVVQCYWPESEDPERLAPVFQRLTAEALKLDARKRKQFEREAKSSNSPNSL